MKNNTAPRGEETAYVPVVGTGVSSANGSNRQSLKQNTGEMVKAAHRAIYTGLKPVEKKD